MLFYVSYSFNYLLPSESEQHKVLLLARSFQDVLAVREYLERNTSGSSLTSAIRKKSYSMVIKKYLKGSAQATIHPLAIILTVDLWALVSIMA